jgi:hypothetical protein
MSLRMSRWPALLLAVAASAGCGTTKAIMVHAISKNGGLEILKGEAHQSVVVTRGDRVAFICDCPAGTTWTVDDIRPLGNLEEIARFLGNGDEPPIEELIKLMDGPEGLGDFERRLSEARGEGRSLPPLFRSWTPPSEAVPIDKAIVSHRVGKLNQVGVWKFTWKLSLNGKEVVWDPHIIGHPDDKW